MTRLLSLILLTAATPLAAQTIPTTEDGRTVREIEVFGSDPCPRSTDSAIFVCRRLGERERFRIPQRLRQGGSLQQRQSWAARVRSIEVNGINGINSCSPVGPGGFTGCTAQVIRDARRQRETGSDQ